ncbi:MAG: hypothetical protein JNM94_11620 [Phycisphaerae bacterium]|nr:hypothetical protein [Phycisphaerae bacterium]
MAIGICYFARARVGLRKRIVACIAILPALAIPTFFLANCAVTFCFYGERHYSDGSEAHLDFLPLGKSARNLTVTRSPSQYAVRCNIERTEFAKLTAALPLVQRDNSASRETRQWQFDYWFGVHGWHADVDAIQVYINPSRVKPQLSIVIYDVQSETMFALFER